MSASSFPLTEALRALGVARAFIGDLFTVAGLEALPTEGEIVPSMPQNLNRLTAPELTGDVAHDAFITPGQMTITVPVIYGGTDTLAKFSAHGSASDGSAGPQSPTYTSLAIIPLREMAGDPPSIGYDGTAWTPGAPVHSLFFWKVVPQRPDMRFAWEGAGKIILPVTFEVFYDITRPVGERLFTQGDPVAKGITTLRI